MKKLYDYHGNKEELFNSEVLQDSDIEFVSFDPIII